jgi:hypothetical protein
VRPAVNHAGIHPGGSCRRAGGCWEAVRTVSVRTTTAGPMSTLSGALIRFTSSGYLISKLQATQCKSQPAGVMLGPWLGVFIES